ncbi:hypothetical protein PCE1_001418 [Barthelona sp. PCE]
MWSHVFGVGIPVGLFVEFFIFGPQVDVFQSLTFGIVLLLAYVLALGETYRLYKIKRLEAASYSIIAGSILSFFAYWISSLVLSTFSDMSTWFDSSNTFSVFTIAFSSVIIHGVLLQSIPAITMLILNRQDFYSSTDALAMGSIANASAYLLQAFFYFPKLATLSWTSSFNFFITVAAKLVVEMILQMCLGSLTAYRMHMISEENDEDDANIFHATLPAAVVASSFGILSGFFETYLPLGDQPTSEVFLAVCSLTAYILIALRMRKYQTAFDSHDKEKNVPVVEVQNRMRAAKSAPKKS